MALTAFGFTGTVDNIAWAKMNDEFGTPYAVGGPTDFQVQTVAGQDRTVRVLPSVEGAMGHGVLVTSNAIETIQLPTISSGTRWDLVSLRRNWAGSGSVSIVSVSGTATRAVPAGRLYNPGVLDDQPLALVQVTAGQTIPTAVVDLRVRAAKVLTASDTLALPTWGGTVGIVGGDIYHWPTEGSSPVRFRGDLPDIQIPGSNSQWAVTGSFQSASGGQATVQMDARSNINIASNLVSNENRLCLLSPGYRPARRIRTTMQIIGSNPRTERNCQVWVDPDGAVILIGPVSVDQRLQGSVTFARA